MGKLLSVDGYTYRDALRDECGVHAAISEVVQLALDLDDAGLADCELQDLEDATEALSLCQRFGCDNHYGQRHAVDALVHAQGVVLQRLADLDEEEAASTRPTCCNSGCAVCLGG